MILIMSSQKQTNEFFFLSFFHPELEKKTKKIQTKTFDHNVNI